MLIPLDLGLPWEREYERPAVRTRRVVRAVVMKRLSRELEWETFELDGYDPSPPHDQATVVPGFDPGSSTLKPAQWSIIRKFAEGAVGQMPLLPATETMLIEVVGHEDDTGDPAKFKKVGDERAKRVSDVLIPLMRKFVDAAPDSSLTRNVDVAHPPSGPGPTKPIRSNATKGGRWWNRRVELRIRWP
jgi:outer membrane protein OmpA-like peptidoglycan-associated protein